MTELIIPLFSFFLGAVLAYFYESHQKNRERIAFEKKLVEVQKQNEERLNKEIEDAKARIFKAAQLDGEARMSQFAVDLLPVADAMEMARHLKSQHAEGLKQGWELVADKFGDVLYKHGVEPIIPEIGSEFDPNLHEAVTCQGGSEEVLELHRVGFMILNKVARPAAVTLGPKSVQSVEVQDAKELKINR